MSLLRVFVLFLPSLFVGLALTAGEGRIETIQVGQTVYRDVRVREISPVAVVILHSGGVAQIPLRQLSPELRARFGYDPDREREFEEGLRQEREQAAISNRPALPSGEGPRVREKRDQVDLRPRYFELGLYTKDQGRRPSCAVFAILGALEFHYSLEQGVAVPLSEEFLIWAALQVNPDRTDFDGFTFGEVLTALRRFGVARSEVMPNTLGAPLDQLRVGTEVREEALGRRQVRIRAAAGAVEERIEAIIEELDEGYPVAVSLAWPYDGVVARVHTLRDQPVRAGSGHAVTIVGYQRPAGAPDEILFLFRNSYGIHWGLGGYGYLSDRYLQKHLWDVVSFRLDQPGE